MGQKRTFRGAIIMSALPRESRHSAAQSECLLKARSRHSWQVSAMSTLIPKADIARVDRMSAKCH